MFIKFPAKLYFIITIVILLSRPLHADGIGFYATGAAGLSTLEDRYRDSFPPINYTIGAGLLYDSAVATNELFNYRLNAGYENIVSSGNPFFKNLSYHRVSLMSTFGLGVVRNKYIRVWAGPQVDIGCQFKNAKIRSHEVASITMYYIRATLFSLGFGAVAGINVHSGNVFSIGLEIGFNTTFGFGMHRYNITITDVWPEGTSIGFFPYILSTDNKDKAFLRIEGFSRLSFIFRFGDSYLPEIVEK